MPVEEQTAAVELIVFKDKRPDGSRAYGLALILVWLGVIAFLATFFIQVESFGGVDPEKVVLRWALLGCASALLYASFIIAVAGYIVRAMSFISGVDEK